MKQIYLKLILLFWVCPVFAQEKYELEYVGTLQLPDNQLLSFKLSFNKLPGGKIEGISLTDIYGTNRTKSKIEGNIEKGSKISFHETRNLSTKSDSDPSEFCFITVDNAKYKNVSNKSIIQGPFVGKYPGGERCISGYVYLVSTKYLEDLSGKMLTSNYVKDADSLALLKKKVNTLKEVAEKNVLKNNDVLTVNWTSAEMIIELWDGEQEDEDEIELYVNGKKVIDRLTLRREKKTIILPVETKINTIKIVGVSEGAAANCTANITLRDGDQVTSAFTFLKKNESAVIKIER
jgi:hypothetical protein